MPWLELFHQAFTNLRAAKMRSFLALLGVLVGTASVVALMGCGRLATEKALEQFRTLGIDLMSVSVYQVADKVTLPARISLPLSFWQRMPDQITDIKDIAPYANSYQPLSFRGRTLEGVVIGADDSLARITHISMQMGTFLSPLYKNEHVCVIGAELARQMHGISMEPLLGKQVKIGNLLFTVIGEAGPWTENGFFNEDINKSVMVPLAGINQFGKDNTINNAIMILKPDSPVDDVMADIKNLIHDAEPNLAVYPRSARQIIAGMESQGKIFTWLLAVIGGISLIVGGIGIMNVMLVSVSERRQEIGIRKAVGAKNRDIRALFLMESLILSTLGGILGAGFGLLLTSVIAWFSGWTFIIYVLPILAGFLVSCVTGIFFGYYPAARAAKMQVVDCLRG